VEVPFVVEPGQAVPLGDLERAAGVQEVLNGDRRVVAEDLEKPAVLLPESAGTDAVDQLEHAAHGGLDPDRDAEDRLGMEARRFIRRVEVRVVHHVLGHVSDAGRIDVAGDPDPRVDPPGETRIAVRSERGDENEVVFEPVFVVLGARVVQKDGAGGRRNELVRLLEDLAQETIDLDLTRVGVVRLMPLEKVFESPIVECIDG